MEEHVDGLMEWVRAALISAAMADYEQAKKAGISEEEVAEIVVSDAVTHILREAELL
jgi:hypothetical protein